MTDMAVHTYIVHPRHLINVAILSQQLQMCVLSFLILINLLQSRRRHRNSFKID